jgi:hypothetical protein
MITNTTAKDQRLAIALTLAGGVSLFAAHRAQWHAQDLAPGIEGCLTASVVGSIMLLLHPLPYAWAAVLSVPLVVSEYLACAYAESYAVGLGMVGLHLVIFGFLGIALALRAPEQRAARRSDRGPQRVVGFDEPGPHPPRSRAALGS